MTYHASRLGPRAKRRRWPERYRHPELYPVRVHGEIGWMRFDGPVRRSWRKGVYHIATTADETRSPDGCGFMRETIACGPQESWCAEFEPRLNPRTQCPRCLKAWREQGKVTP